MDEMQTVRIISNSVIFVFINFGIIVFLSIVNIIFINHFSDKTWKSINKLIKMIAVGTTAFCIIISFTSLYVNGWYYGKNNFIERAYKRGQQAEKLEDNPYGWWMPSLNHAFDLGWESKHGEPE